MGSQVLQADSQEEASPMQGVIGLQGRGGAEVDVKVEVDEPPSSNVLECRAYSVLYSVGRMSHGGLVRCAWD